MQSTLEPWKKTRQDRQQAGEAGAYAPEGTPGGGAAFEETQSAGTAGDYGRYSQQIAGVYREITKDDGFRYDPEKDPLYRQYRTLYIQNGQRAMRDAAGTAAALTGGYGNSWAASAGFQAYDWYLQQLNQALPELEETAYQRYLTALGSPGRGGGSGSAKGAAEAEDYGEMTTLPVLKTNLLGQENPGPLAEHTPAMPTGQAQALLAQMEALYAEAQQGKKHKKRAAQAEALRELASRMAQSESSGLMASDLGWAALQAAWNAVGKKKK